jgi:sarcosine oxidase
MARGTGVLVVGAGVIGMSATLALADRGVDVLCVEQARPGAGQSGGQVRNFRHFHHNTDMIERAIEAHRGWVLWEERFNTPLLAQVGLVTLGDSTRHIADVLQQCRVPATFAEVAGSVSRLPSGAWWDAPLVVDETAGPIAAEVTLQVLHRALSGRLLDATVLALRAYPDRVDVATTAGSFHADQVLVCAGPQTDRIASSVGIRIDTVRAVHTRPCYYVKGERRHNEEALGSLIDASNLFGPSVYGAPTPDGRHFVVGLNGVGDDTPIRAGTDYEADATSVRADSSLVSKYVAAALTELDPNPVSTRVCTTTAIAGERLTFLVGNNLFKFAPLLGPALADAVAGKGPDWLVRLV